jgi:hypothetical protein
MSSLSSLSILFGLDNDLYVFSINLFVDVVVPSSISVIVERSSLRAITFVSARCASLRLTSIAPTPFDVHIHYRREIAATAAVAISPTVTC